MAGKARIEYLRKNYPAMLRTNQCFSFMSSLAKSLSSAVPAKTTSHAFRGSKDGRAMSVVWTNAKNDKEAYEARKKLKGIVATWKYR